MDIFPNPSLKNAIYCWFLTYTGIIVYLSITVYIPCGTISLFGSDGYDLNWHNSWNLDGKCQVYECVWMRVLVCVDARARVRGRACYPFYGARNYDIKWKIKWNLDGLFQLYNSASCLLWVHEASMILAIHFQPWTKRSAFETLGPQGSDDKFVVVRHELGN